MASEEHLEILHTAWNEWREATLDVRPDLDGAILKGAILIGADLSAAHLTAGNITARTSTARYAWQMTGSAKAAGSVGFRRSQAFKSR